MYILIRLILASVFYTRPDAFDPLKLREEIDYFEEDTGVAG
jgi:hypothetical protein